ncbi:MAG: hypothetical protein QXJ05_05575 [Nitrososphaerota archaeon]
MSAPRLSKSQLWRAVGKISIELEERHIEILRSLAEYLARVAGSHKLFSRIIRRIRPRTREELLELTGLYEYARPPSLLYGEAANLLIEAR